MEFHLAKPLHFLTFLLLLINSTKKMEATTFTFINKCPETIWPGVLSNAGSPQLETTGFELPSGSSRSFLAPTGWSGRFWGRTGCSPSSPASWSCATGDCASNQQSCNGAGAAPPVTLAEFTIASTSASLDFYDVSLVDGFNVPVLVQPRPGSLAGAGGCGAAGCVADLSQQCPAELRAGGAACRSACEAFRRPEFCCSGEFASPATCRPSAYSQMFKAVCPRSYSYAFDDPTSTFTCGGGPDYDVTFCPVSMPSQKSSRDSPSFSTPTPTTSTDSQTSSTSTTTPTTTTTTTTTGQVMLQDESWLANLATGQSFSPKFTPILVLQTISIGFTIAHIFLCH